ncbi:MAG: N-acetyltransferase [Bacteroidetes bacterium]|nr:N-acetyltransferase [Bacteroidota bacterium]
MKYKIHPLSDVQTDSIGEGTTIWQYCVILKNAKIGLNCNINCQVLIENDVVIGNNVTIKPGVQVWDGLRIGNNVFIGPNVTFTNDLIPRSKVYPEVFENTFIEDGASIGANATILSGITIGSNALIGAGSVVTKNIPPHTIWYGNPARQKGYININNIIVDMSLQDKNGNMYKLHNGIPQLISND